MIMEQKGRVVWAWGCLSFYRIYVIKEYNNKSNVFTNRFCGLFFSIRNTVGPQINSTSFGTIEINLVDFLYFMNIFVWREVLTTHAKYPADQPNLNNRCHYNLYKENTALCQEYHY